MDACQQHIDKANKMKNQIDKINKEILVLDVKVHSDNAVAYIYLQELREKALELKICTNELEDHEDALKLCLEKNSN